MKVTQFPKREFVPEAEIAVPHEDKEINFIAPYFGSAGYSTVRTGIEKAELRMPNFAETVSLAYDSFVTDRKRKYSEKIRKLMHSSWLRASNGILYVPNKGAYIQDSPDFKDGKVVMDESNLVKRLEANDNSVRFVHFGYKLESQTSKELENNPFIVGLAGKNGASKLAMIADKFRNKPYVWSFKNVDELTLRFAGLRSVGFGGYMLGVNGSWYGYDNDGRAFGVSPVSVADESVKI